MTVSAAPGYGAWRSIDYQPAVPILLPSNLLPYAHPGSRVLEIGCGRGQVAMFLARAGLHVMGIDLNDSAVLEAETHARSEGLESSTRFLVGDILDERLVIDPVDIVVMIRVLTCFSNRADWRRLIDRALRCLNVEGLIYIHDFLLTEDSPQYQARYEAGTRLGWRRGSFPVRGGHGGLLFVAHHHSREEVNEIGQPYEILFSDEHASLSMNGNPCKMFELVGRVRSSTSESSG